MVDFFPSLFSLHGYVSIGLKYIYIYILQIYRFIKSRVFFIITILNINYLHIHIIHKTNNKMNFQHFIIDPQHKMGFVLLDL
jgi:hypothetical protein